MRYINRFAVLLKRLGVLLLSVFVFIAVWEIYKTLIPNVWYGRNLAISLAILWLMSAYFVLPRIHRILSRIYLPNYFVGRTRTVDGLLSDPVNLAINGSKAALIRAMESSGWNQADPRTIKTRIRIAITSVLGRSYPSAPVSDLYIFGNKQDLVFQIQQAGNPRKRHHVRFWRVPRQWYLPGGYKVDWVGAATYDDSVGISLFTMQITHSIDADVDEERDFLIQSLQKAGVLKTVSHIAHYFTGYKARNGINGSHMVTDGSLIIADLIDESPARSAHEIRHATLDDIQTEVYNLNQATNTAAISTDKLIEQIEQTTDKLRQAYHSKKSAKAIGSQSIDLLINNLSLLSSLDQKSSNLYRKRMDSSWQQIREGGEKQS